MVLPSGEGWGGSFLRPPGSRAFLLTPTHDFTERDKVVCLDSQKRSGVRERATIDIGEARFGEPLSENGQLPIIDGDPGLHW